MPLDLLVAALLRVPVLCIQQDRQCWIELFSIRESLHHVNTRSVPRAFKSCAVVPVAVEMVQLCCIAGAATQYRGNHAPHTTPRCQGRRPTHTALRLTPPHPTHLDVVRRMT